MIAETYFDPQAIYMGATGAWRARLRDNHGIHDCAGSPADALAQLAVTAATHGYSVTGSVAISTPRPGS